MTHKYATVLSERLKELRQAKHMTQKDMSIKTGLSIGMISQLESGSKRLSQDSFISILDALNITPMDFFSGYSTEEAHTLNDVLHILRSNNVNARSFLKTITYALLVIVKSEKHGNKNIDVLDALNIHTKHLCKHLDKLNIAPSKISSKKIRSK